ncbi:MAG: hypothetical protein Q8N83_14115 [Ignavibacteria bacterium]|nr:hypothetical protein [Ignavibacteria bacterium]
MENIKVPTLNSSKKLFLKQFEKSKLINFYEAVFNYYLKLLRIEYKKFNNLFFRTHKSNYLIDSFYFKLMDTLQSDFDLTEEIFNHRKDKNKAYSTGFIEHRKQIEQLYENDTDSYFAYCIKQDAKDFIREMFFDLYVLLYYNNKKNRYGKGKSVKKQDQIIYDAIEKELGEMFERNESAAVRAVLRKNSIHLSEIKKNNLIKNFNKRKNKGLLQTNKTL